MKPRVHEIARELGMNSKQLLDLMAQRGIYVRGPSSTLEPPVVRRLRHEFGDSDAAARAVFMKPVPSPFEDSGVRRPAQTESDLFDEVPRPGEDMLDVALRLAAQGGGNGARQRPRGAQRKRQRGHEKVPGNAPRMWQSDEVRQEWQSAGILYPSDRDKWIKAGIFTSDAARGWIRARVTKPKDAEMLMDLGVEPSDIEPWLRTSISLSEVLRYLDAGLVASDLDRKVWGRTVRDHVKSGTRPDVIVGGLLSQEADSA